MLICAICVLTFSVPVFSEEVPYFSTINARLKNLEETFVFFQEHVCPEESEPLQCTEVFKKEQKSSVQLRALLEETRVLYVRMETDPGLAIQAWEHMQKVRKDIIPFIRRGQRLAYQYAE